MGEGDGKKDVSDEIEDEEQILGLEGEEEMEKNEEQTKRELDEDEADTGLEMEVGSTHASHLLTQVAPSQLTPHTLTLERVRRRHVRRARPQTRREGAACFNIL